MVRLSISPSHALMRPMTFACVDCSCSFSHWHRSDCRVFVREFMRDHVRLILFIELVKARANGRVCSWYRYIIKVKGSCRFNFGNRNLLFSIESDCWIFCGSLEINKRRGAVRNIDICVGSSRLVIDFWMLWFILNLDLAVTYRGIYSYYCLNKHLTVSARWEWQWIFKQRSKSDCI